MVLVPTFNDKKQWIEEEATWGSALPGPRDASHGYSHYCPKCSSGFPHPLIRKRVEEIDKSFFTSLQWGKSNLVEHKEKAVVKAAFLCVLSSLLWLTGRNSGRPRPLSRTARTGDKGQTTPPSPARPGHTPCPAGAALETERAERDDLVGTGFEQYRLKQREYR